MEKTAKKLFRIERLEKRIAPSKLVCGLSGGSKKGGSHKGGSHKGGSNKGGSHKGGSKHGGSNHCPAPKSQPCA